MSTGISPTYDEIMERAAALAASSGPAALEEIGPSELGRPIPKLVLGDVGRDLPVLMVTGGTHGCEETGRAASMALAEWLAGEGSGHLESMSVVVIPCLNPDGAVLDSYHNGKDVNVYRSYGHLRSSTTAEGRAAEAVAAEVLPDCYVDVHGLAGGAMGGSEYVHPRLASGMGLQIGFAVAAEMDSAALAAGIPQRHPRLEGEFKAAEGSLCDKLSSETNALCFTLEITEKYYPLEDSVTSGLERLKRLVEIGTRAQYCQPYAGFPSDVLVGGPMFALMAFGSTYRARRENRRATLAAILESRFCNFTRSVSDRGGAAELTLSLDDGASTFPEGVVMQAALDPRAEIARVAAVWPQGDEMPLAEGAPDGYTVWTLDGPGIQLVRASVARPPAPGESKVRIEYAVPFEPHDPPGGA